MAENSAMPLWLDIKKEYIDANFEGVLTYLYKRVKSPDQQDSFYKTTLSLLEERMKSLVQTINAAPLQEHMCKDEELEFVCRISGLYLLVFPNDCDLRRNAFSLMLQSLLLISHQHEQHLAEISIANLLGKISGKLPFGWDDIMDFKPQILAHKVSNMTMQTSGSENEYWFEGKGTVVLKKGELAISSLSADNPTRSLLVPAISLLDDQIHILSPKSSKVKKSELDNLQAMAEFTRDFIRDMKEPVCKSRKQAKHYENGEQVDVKITRKDNSGRLWVKTIDKEYETIEGYIDMPSRLLNYYPEEIYSFLMVGDLITLNIKDAAAGIFDMEQEFKKYIIEERAKPNPTSFAYITTINKDSSGNLKAYMWSDQGYVAQAYVYDDYKVGDYVQIKNKKYGEEPYYGVVLADILSLSDDEFSVSEAKRDCISYFCLSQEEDEDVTNVLTEDMLRLLCRVLHGYQRNLPRPSDRFRVLCVLRILSEMTKDELNAKYINFLADYMEALVFFAKGEYDKISPLEFTGDSEPDTVARRKRVVEILSAYGNDAMNDALTDIIENDEDELIHKIAILVQSCNRIDHVISKSMQNVIKREIIKCLAIEAEGETDLEEENGTYLGIENDRQEFKTSFFHAPKNAKEQNQKLTILRGVCAFLNTRVGGTLYLGVDDLGYVKGVEDDIKHMEKVAYGSYKGIDGYMRYITDEAKKYFDISIMTNIRIVPMYDGQVVAIEVSPYEYDIVSIDDQPYIRINSETIHMTEAMRRQLMAQRILSKKEDAANVASLMDAIEGKRKAVLHGYSSSNSGEVKDRTVEPFAFASNRNIIWCYDLEKKVNKVFKVDRINNVEILADRWEYETHHRQGKMDVFRMTGDTPMPIKLQLSLMAKNILVEEYPEASKDLIPTANDDVWILETNVYQIEGIGRFYMGLAGEIQIIDAKGLKDYAQKYSKDYIA